MSQRERTAMKSGAREVNPNDFQARLTSLISRHLLFGRIQKPRTDFHGVQKINPGDVGDALRDTLSATMRLNPLMFPSRPVKPSLILLFFILSHHQVNQSVQNL